MDRRLKLLFLCHTLPYPPDGGIWIRTYHVLRMLAQAFDVTALCFERAASSGADTSEQTAAARQGLGHLVVGRSIQDSQRHSRARFIDDHFRSAVSDASPDAV